MRTYENFSPLFSDRNTWTLGHILRDRARRFPTKVFLHAQDEATSFTFGEMLSHAERVAARLLTAGGQKGDRLVVLASNSSRFVHTWFGSALAGQVMVPINTAYDGEFLAHQIRTVEAVGAVIDDRFAERFVRIKDDATTIRNFWVIDTGCQDEAIRTLKKHGWQAYPWEDLLAGEKGPLPPVGPSDLAGILFTSGTTGPSKGVAMPHAQMTFFAEETVALARFTADDTWFSCTPMFHGNALYMAAYPALVSGGRFAMRAKFSASGWVDHVRDANATVTNFLGVMMDFVWKTPRRRDDRENPLRCVFAAPTASSLLEPMKDRFGIEAFVEVFGLTETSAPILTPYGEARPPGAVGLAIADWFDVDIVDPATDESVAVNEVGELVVRPRFPNICSAGYYGMPEKTLETWRNLWFHTGDALRRDESGWFYFVDRYKDALRRRGENISSYELESALLKHPSIAEAAVVAVPADSEGGEDEVMAVIVVAGGADLSLDELWEWTDQELPEFARPRFVRFLNNLPKTPSQKIQKEKLRVLGRGPGAHDRWETDGRH